MKEGGGYDKIRGLGEEVEKVKCLFQYLETDVSVSDQRIYENRLAEPKEQTNMEEGEAHTCSAAPAAEAELQSSSNPALPSAHHPLPQPAALYQS